MVLEYLKRRAGDLQGADQMAVTGAVTALAGALGVNPTNASDRCAVYLYRG